MPTLGGVNSKYLIYNSFNLDKELTKVDNVSVLTSGKITKEDIGKTVYLSNSATSCQEWVIADVDHDSASGTVDLFSKYIVKESTQINSAYGLNADPSKDGLYREWLNTNLYNGFATIVRTSLKDQVYKNVNGKDASDKVKCPSATEVGCLGVAYANQYYHVDTDGSIYPLFGTQQLYGNSLAIFKKINGSKCGYWTRTRYYGYTSSGALVAYINENGCINPLDWSVYSNGIAVIRF